MKILDNNGVKQSVDEKMDSTSGMGWIVTALILVAELVGSGVVALPSAFVRTGISLGCLHMLVLIVFFAYTAQQIGACWVIMLKRWSIYQKYCRKPYSEIAFRSMGCRIRTLTEFCVYLTQFGICVVFLLLPAQIIQNLVASWNIKISLCFLLIIVAVCIAPVTFLRSPANFCWILLIAVATTVLAVVLVLVGAGLDYGYCAKEANYPETTFARSLFGLGTFMFTLCGHAYFPTIQHDMRKPEQFTRSVILAFIFVGVLYLPLSVYSFIVYGDSIRGSIITSIQTSWIRVVANIGIGTHCFLTLILTLNPLQQKMEHVFKAPHSFSFKRVIIRVGVIFAALLVALSVPDFSPVMDILGSAITPVTTIFFPIIFNLWLNAAHYDSLQKEYVRPTIKQVYARTSKLKLIWNLIIMFSTVLGAAVALYMAVRNFVTVEFTPPCYARPFLSSSYETYEGDTVNCCGKSRNIIASNSSFYCISKKAAIIYENSI